MARSKEESSANKAQRPKGGPSRAERNAGKGETPSKRSERGNRNVARQDQESGVASRARKRIQGSETVPDPKFASRPGVRKTPRTK